MVLDFKIADIVDAHGVELADVVAAHEMKMDAMRVKLKKLENMSLVKRLGIIMLLVQ